MLVGCGSKDEFGLGKYDGRSYKNESFKLDIKIPEDFSLSGFGGYSESDYAYPRITTVDYPFYELGKKALELLKKLIATGSIPLLQTMGNELHVKPSTRQLD